MRCRSRGQMDMHLHGYVSAAILDIGYTRSPHLCEPERLGSYQSNFVLHAPRQTLTKPDHISKPSHHEERRFVIGEFKKTMS